MERFDADLLLVAGGWNPAVQLCGIRDLGRNPGAHGPLAADPAHDEVLVEVPPADWDTITINNGHIVTQDINRVYGDNAHNVTHAIQINGANAVAQSNALRASAASRIC